MHSEGTDQARICGTHLDPAGGAVLKDSAACLGECTRAYLKVYAGNLWGCVRNRLNWNGGE